MIFIYGHSVLHSTGLPSSKTFKQIFPQDTHNAFPTKVYIRWHFTRKINQNFVDYKDVLIKCLYLVKFFVFVVEFTFYSNKRLKSRYITKMNIARVQYIFLKKKVD